MVFFHYFFLAITVLAFLPVLHEDIVYSKSSCLGETLTNISVYDFPPIEPCSKRVNLLSLNDGDGLLFFNCFNTLHRAVNETLILIDSSLALP